MKRQVLQNLVVILGLVTVMAVISWLHNHHLTDGQEKRNAVIRAAERQNLLAEFRSLQKLAKNLWQKGKLDESKDAFDASLAFAKDKLTADCHALAFLDLLDVEQKLGNERRAGDLLKMAENAVKEAPNTVELEEALSQLYILYESCSDAEKMKFYKERLSRTRLAINQR